MLADTWSWINARATALAWLRAGLESHRFCLTYRPPYDWDAVLAFLKARATPGVESVADGRYRRTISLDANSGIVEISHLESRSALALDVHFPDPRALPFIVERARRMFDLGADPAAIGEHLGADPLLRQPLARHPGIRTPGAWDGFELAVRAILGQQVSVRAATTIAGRIASMFGSPLEHAGGLERLFPTAAQLADAAIERAGVMPARAATIRGSRVVWPTGRSCSARALTDRPRFRRSGRCPASATGRRSTSRCARSASPMRFRAAIWFCAVRPAAARRASWSASRMRGARGAPTRLCCSGRTPRISATSMTRSLSEMGGGKRQLVPRASPVRSVTLRAVLRAVRRQRCAVFRPGEQGYITRRRRVWLTDINQDLLGTYHALATHAEPVIAALEQHELLHRAAPREHYYRVRDELFNPRRRRLFDTAAPCSRSRHIHPTLAAMFIYLNRTGFNGLFRLNSHGSFNVPAGRYANPRICNSDNLRAVAGVLGAPAVTVAYGSFESVLAQAQHGDLLYLDPPYAPVSTTANFTAYTGVRIRRR